MNFEAPPIFPSSLEPDMRARLRAQLLAGDCPAHAVDEVVDLAFHGAQGALDAIYAVAGRCSSIDAAMAVLSGALGLALAGLRAQQDAVIEVGKARGGRVIAVGMAEASHG